MPADLLQTATGTVAAVYTENGYIRVDINLDDGEIVQASQAANKPQYAAKYKALAEKQRVVVNEKKWNDRTFWDVDFKKTDDLPNAQPAAKPALDITLEEYVWGAKYVLNSILSGLGKDAPEEVLKAAVPFATSVWIAVAQHPSCLKRKPGPAKPQDVLVEEFALGDGELPF